MTDATTETAIGMRGLGTIVTAVSVQGRLVVMTDVVPVRLLPGAIMMTEGPTTIIAGGTMTEGPLLTSNTPTGNAVATIHPSASGTIVVATIGKSDMMTALPGPLPPMVGLAN